MDEKEKNPFEVINDIYKEQVAREDERDLADVFKGATEQLFKHIQAEFENTTITFEDIEYGDGYYIFGMGTNSVINFHIKETPGWLYGIWWSGIEEKKSTKKNPKYRKDEVSFKFFAQYESEIDKFKPSASAIMVEKERYIYPDEDYVKNYVGDIANQIKFIIKEPYLAFYRHYYNADLNTRFVSRREAKKEFLKCQRYRKNKAIVERKCTKIMINATKKVLQTLFPEGQYFIYDMGDTWSPRYDIMLKNIEREYYDLEPGCYSFYHNVDGFEYAVIKYFERQKAKCERIAKRYHVWWTNDVSRCFDVRDEKLYEELKQDYVKENAIIFSA